MFCFPDLEIPFFFPLKLCCIVYNNLVDYIFANKDEMIAFSLHLFPLELEILRIPIFMTNDLHKF